MKKISLLMLTVISALQLFAQIAGERGKSINANLANEKPKLVIGIVVDQMRWDFLYKYQNRYTANGFKRLLKNGFSCENTFIPYTPTVTAAGHTCIYTGSVPAIHGIVGNNWIDRQSQKNIYCSEDSLVSTVGSNSKNGKMSPRNMLTTTIGDELRLATNFRSKVIGIALKDRGAILPAGHSANAAYWYDNTTGNWITSTYYMNQLPKWVSDLNNRKLVDSFYHLNWQTLYPINTYAQSTSDEQVYEGKPFGNDQVKFPYDLSKFAGKNPGIIASTPYGNTLTLEMAKAAIVNEQLGQGSETDMLCVSFSSTDYVGHGFGPNSIEVEDTYLRLDKEIGALLTFLDRKVGEGKYTLFLSADHGVAHVPAFMQANKLPGGVVDEKLLQVELNNLLLSQTGIKSLVTSLFNYQVHFNNQLIDSAKLNKKQLCGIITDFLVKKDGIAFAFPINELGNTLLPATMREMFNNGYFYNRDGDVQIVLKPGYIDGGKTGTTHGLWNPYDAHIPMLFFGNGIKSGKILTKTYMTDIAATITSLLQIQMPNGCVGNVVVNALK